MQVHQPPMQLINHKRFVAIKNKCMAIYVQTYIHILTTQIRFVCTKFRQVQGQNTHCFVTMQLAVMLLSHPWIISQVLKLLGTHYTGKLFITARNVLITLCFSCVEQISTSVSTTSWYLLQTLVYTGELGSSIVAIYPALRSSALLIRLLLSV